MGLGLRGVKLLLLLLRGLFPSSSEGSTITMDAKRAKGESAETGKGVEDVGAGSAAVARLLAVVRDATTPRVEFARAMDRLCARLADETVARLRSVGERRVETPTGEAWTGLGEPRREVCLVSILRSGDIVLRAMLDALPHAAVGKVLIQRDESDPEKKCTLVWSKLPADVAAREVVMCDPMLATGGTAIACVRELVKAGCSPADVTFANVISCPEGLAALRREFPLVNVVTLAVDRGLNQSKYIVPGLGDAGDRYFGTIETA